MLPASDWARPNQELFQTLRPGQVHIWRASLENSSTQAGIYSPYLSPYEKDKAKRYRFPHLQYQYVTVRGILRLLLSRYLNTQPGCLQFKSNNFGKPNLANANFSHLQFNVSHASNMALLAFTADYPVGIDLECLDRRVEDREIAARYFSKRESTDLSSISSEISSEERTRKFFTYWTCKEAYLKMRGIGLSEGLSQCEIILETNRSQASVSLREDGLLKEEKECSLYRLDVSRQHVGAIAVGCSLAEISYWDWKD